MARRCIPLFLGLFLYGSMKNVLYIVLSLVLLVVDGERHSAVAMLSHTYTQSLGVCASMCMWSHAVHEGNIYTGRAVMKINPWGRDLP